MSIRRARLFVLTSPAALFLCALLATVGLAARQDAPATVDVQAPSGTVSTAHAVVQVPVTLTRADATPLSSFSVQLRLAPELTLAGGSAGIHEGDFLSSGGGTTTLAAIDKGDGVWEIDGATLGEPIGTTALSGTLFTVDVTSASAAAAALVGIGGVRLRDASNGDLPYAIGSSATVVVDNTLPLVSVTAPNGGEFWPTAGTRAITWTASDAAGPVTIGLSYSTDGGATFPNAIAGGLANSGSYAWTIPAGTSATVRVRAVATDVNANSAGDASDADFSTGPWTISASAGAYGVIAPAGVVAVNDGGSQAFTIGADSGYHIGDVLVDGVSTGPVTGYTFSSVSANHSISASFIVNPAASPLANFVAAPLRSGNGGGGTTRIRLTWTAPPAGSTVEVWRAGWGDYPNYDAGALPALPTGYPPAAPWTLTGVTASGQTDQPGTRDFYYYVAYVTNSYGNRSPVSGRTAGTLDYSLGDVTGAGGPGNGDTRVDTQDLSLLGAHYGATGAGVAAWRYLDVGPTSDFSLEGRPLTDNQLEFEDLVMFALHYGVVGAPPAASRPASSVAENDALALAVSELAPGDVQARVSLAGAGDVHALRLALAWNATVVAPRGLRAAAWLEEQGGVLFAPAAGRADIAALGEARQGLLGEGDLALANFRRLGPGDPGIVLVSAEARDGENHRVALALPAGAPGMLPVRTALEPARPSPFHDRTALEFSLARAGQARLAIFSVDGRLVRTLDDGVRAPGRYTVTWDGRASSGRVAPPGLYFARLSTDDGRWTRSLVRID